MFGQSEPFHVRPYGNVTVIEQTDGFVLIDAGGSIRAGRDLVAFIRSLGNKPLKAVVITHTHWDHWLGLAPLREAWPDARIISTLLTRDHLAARAVTGIPPTIDRAKAEAMQAGVRNRVSELQRQGGSPGLSPEEREHFRRAAAEVRQFGCDLVGAVTVVPTETFTERLLLDDPQAPVELIFAGRAHTDGDAVAWLPRQRVLAVGDVVVGPVPFGGGPTFPGEWIDVLQRLVSLDPAIVVPGHGRAYQGTAYMEQMIWALADTRAQVGTLVRRGVPQDQIYSRMNFDRQREAFVGSDAWLRRWFDDYWAQGITATAYREAAGIPIM